jgi:hypothetical protein
MLSAIFTTQSLMTFQAGCSVNEGNNYGPVKISLPGQRNVLGEIDISS